MVSAPSTDEEHSSEQFAFDTVLVFGIGPVKAILLPEQLTPQQYRALDLYISDPLKYPEPNFWLMQKPRHLAQIAKIEQQKDLTPQEKETLKENEMQSWQRIGWYALKKMGRQNALAAGLALYKGLTKKVILSGGHTISPWTKKNLSKSRLENWPSEAELMAEVIKSSYGAMYEKKYGRKIEDAIEMESGSTNTLENFAYCVNQYPQLLSKDKKIGVLSAGYHMKRIKLISQIFGIQLGEKGELTSRDILRGEDMDSIDGIIDEQNYSDAVRQFNREKRWIKALNDPEYVSYWLGYVAEVKDLYVIQKAIDKFHDLAWKEAASVALEKVKLDIDEVANTNLATLAKTNPDKYIEFITALKQLKQPIYRRIPPEEISETIEAV